MADKCTKRGGRIGCAKGGEADFRDGLVQQFSCDGEAMHVGQFALIGGHTIGGVALYVLDGVHAFAHGQGDVLGVHIVLKIDKGLALLGGCSGSADDTACGGDIMFYFDFWRSRASRFCGFCKDFAQIICAVAAAN